MHCNSPWSEASLLHEYSRDSSDLWGTTAVDEAHGNVVVKSVRRSCNDAIDMSHMTYFLRSIDGGFSRGSVTAFVLGPALSRPNEAIFSGTRAFQSRCNLCTFLSCGTCMAVMRDAQLALLASSYLRCALYPGMCFPELQYAQNNELSKNRVRAHNCSYFEVKKTIVTKDLVIEGTLDVQTSNLYSSGFFQHYSTALSILTICDCCCSVCFPSSSLTCNAHPFPQSCPVHRITRKSTKRQSSSSAFPVGTAPHMSAANHKYPISLLVGLPGRTSLIDV